MCFLTRVALSLPAVPRGHLAQDAASNARSGRTHQGLEVLRVVAGVGGGEGPQHRVPLVALQRRGEEAAAEVRGQHVAARRFPGCRPAGELHPGLVAARGRRRQRGAAQGLRPGDRGPSAAGFPSPGVELGKEVTDDSGENALTSVLCRTLGSITQCEEHEVWRATSRTPPAPEPQAWRSRYGTQRGQNPGTRGRPGLAAPLPAATAYLPALRSHAAPPTRPRPAPLRALTCRAQPAPARGLPRIPAGQCAGQRCPCRCQSPLQQRQMETVPGPALGTCLCPGSAGCACFSHLGNCHLLNKSVPSGAGALHRWSHLTPRETEARSDAILSQDTVANAESFLSTLQPPEFSQLLKCMTSDLPRSSCVEGLEQEA